MEGEFDQQRVNEYQNKVADWIGRQGMLFQLRYAKTSGSRSLPKQLGGLMIRVVFLLVVVGLVGFLIVRRHHGSLAYKEEITSQLEESLGGEVVEISGFSRDSSSGGFNGLKIKGGEKSFFYQAKLEGLTSAFSLLTGITKDWRPETVRVENADFEIKAGGAKEEMDSSFASVVESLSGGGLTSVKIDNFTCDWGYSDFTYGLIRNASFGATLKNRSWEVKVSGGTIEQNWLGPLPIEEGIFLVNENGVEVVSLKLSLGKGTLEFTGKISGPPAMPKFNLKGEFTQMPIERLLQLNGVKTREFLEGTISGSLKITGSTNRRVKMSGNAYLGAGDQITIRERWKILRALSILDSDRSYLRLGFKEGSFSFTTDNGGMEVKNIDLVSGENAKLVGGFSTRLPSREEAAESLGITLVEDTTNAFADDFAKKSTAQKLRDARFSLRKSIGEDSERVGADAIDSIDDGISRIDKEELSAKEVEELTLKAELMAHRINGELKLAVPSSSFENIESLAEIYPSDGEGWRWVPITLKDEKFTTISEEANEELLERSQIRSVDSGDVDR